MSDDAWNAWGQLVDGFLTFAQAMSREAESIFSLFWLLWWISEPREIYNTIVIDIVCNIIS